MLLLQIYSYIYGQRYKSKSWNPKPKTRTRHSLLSNSNLLIYRNMASSQMMMMARTTCSKKLFYQDMIKFQETKSLMNIIKYIIRLNISKPNGNHHNYINIRINLSTAANSIVYWRCTIINQSYAAIVDLFLYLWSKIQVQILEPETENPYSSFPALQLQPFDIQKYGIIYSQARVYII